MGFPSIPIPPTVRRCKIGRRMTTARLFAPNWKRRLIERQLFLWVAFKSNFIVRTRLLKSCSPAYKIFCGGFAHVSLQAAFCCMCLPAWRDPAVFMEMLTGVDTSFVTDLFLPLIDNKTCLFVMFN